MNVLIKLSIVTILGSLLLSACTVAKLEARLEANPQCKDVINTKTGAVMPCPGTDKSFYRSVGLEPAKPVSPVASATPSVAGVAVAADPAIKPSSSNTASVPNVSAPSVQSPVDCKPQLHKKTGGMMPCPSPD